MMATEQLTHADPPVRRRRFASIRQKLERILISNSRKLKPFRAEVVSIIDTLDALNRDNGVMKKRGRLGDIDGD